MPYGMAVATPYASSTSTLLSGVIENVSTPANLSSTLADSVSSDSAMLKLRGPGAISPPGTKPAIRYLFGSCDWLMYAPCNTAEIAGLNAAMPEAVAGAASADAGGGADAVDSAAFSRS